MSRDINTTKNSQDYIPQVFGEIKASTTKKVSDKLMESNVRHILGALSKLDVFRLNSETVVQFRNAPVTSHDAGSENQTPNGNVFLNDLHHEEDHTGKVSLHVVNPEPTTVYYVYLITFGQRFLNCASKPRITQLCARCFSSKKFSQKIKSQVLCI